MSSISDQEEQTEPPLKRQKADEVDQKLDKPKSKLDSNLDSIDMLR